MLTVLEAMGQFLDWWIGIVIAVLLFYLFKFLFMFGGEDEEQRRRRKEEWLSDITKWQKVRQEAQKQQQALAQQARERKEQTRIDKKNAFLDWLLGAGKKEVDQLKALLESIGGTLEGAIETLRSGHVDEARKKLEAIQASLVSAVKDSSLAGMTKGTPAEKVASSIEKALAHLLTKVERLDFTRSVDTVENKLGDIAALLDRLLEEVTYLSKKLAALQASPGFRPVGVIRKRK